MVANRNHQTGAIAVAFALMSIVLLAFVGLGMDAGRLYIAKTELQNAADACSLAASAALTGSNANQLQAAEDMGAAAVGRNKVAMQSVGAQFVANASMTFSNVLNGVYRTRTAVPGGEVLDQRFVRCALTEANIDSILLKVASLIPGSAPFTAQSVNAGAVASLIPSISHCAIPIAACTSSATPPHFGLDPGTWYRGKIPTGPSNQQSTGAFRWVSFPGATSGIPALETLLAGTGQCNLNAATQVASQNGAGGSLYDAYSGRFGVYKGGNINNLTGAPDLTGYPYFPPVVVPPANQSYVPANSAMPDFLLKRAANAPFTNITNLPLKPGWNKIPGPGPAVSHQASGGDRRLAVLPMTDCSTLSNAGQPIQGWGCFLMLHPIFAPGDDMWLEFRGNAASISSGCVSSGLPGGPGAGGPKVPGLVQ